jgi:Na+-translocating ferredoxin:NAD+ oxidoreductase subunit G
MSDDTLVQTTSSLALVRTLGLVSALCGVLIVAAYQLTLPAVKANKQIALERAVFKVIPGAKNLRAYHATAGGLVPDNGTMPEGGVKFYAAYDAAGALKGIAAEGAARGYADMVRVLYAYDPGCQCITGMGVVSMRETPGFGDKVFTDQPFIDSFKALDVRLKDDLSALAHDIVTVRRGKKTEAWQIDAISGATITSRAIGKGVNDSAKKLLPLLYPHIEQLRSEAK